MLISCTRCRVRNLPHAAMCASCGGEIQSAGDASRKAEEYSRLEAALRANLEETQRASVTTRQRWLENLRDRRPLHMVLGALLFGIPD
jgi:hypothetical protein